VRARVRETAARSRGKRTYKVYGLPSIKRVGSGRL